MKTESLDLFVFADALGWTQVEKRAFMRDLFPFRAPCETVFGYSASCDPSILTGTLPAQHGHFSCFVFDPEKSPFRWAKHLGWLPEAVAAHPRVRKCVSRWVAARNRYPDTFQLCNIPFSQLPWFDYTEKRDIHEPGGINGGQRTIFEYWRESELPWMRSDWRAGDAANIASLRAEIGRGEIRLAYLYIGGLDAAMRAHGAGSPRVDAAFAEFERRLRDLHAVARSRYREVRIHLFSNHGMTDTLAGSRMKLDFEMAGFAFPRDYAAAWDSTMARFWFPGGDAIREQICDWLRLRPEGRILTAEELESWGCHFPDHRYGEIFYLLNHGTVFAPSFMNRNTLPGMHGFDPREPDSRACWLTTYPCERNPARINGIFHVMRAAAEKLSTASVDFGD